MQRKKQAKVLSCVEKTFLKLLYTLTVGTLDQDNKHFKTLDLAKNGTYPKGCSSTMVIFLKGSAKIYITFPMYNVKNQQRKITTRTFVSVTHTST